MHWLVADDGLMSVNMDCNDEDGILAENLYVLKMVSKKTY